MKNKFLWALIGVMAVTALVLAACAPPSNGDVNGNGDDVPQYGGTIKVRRVSSTTAGFEPVHWLNNAMLNVIFDRYYTVPWERGQAGTGEYTYKQSWYPRDMYVGELLESFEVVSLYQIDYKLREGIHYWDKAPVNGRELTTEDVMWNWLYRVFHEREESYLAADPVGAAFFWEEYMQEIEDGVQPEQPFLDYLTGIREYTPTLEVYYPGLETMHRSEFAESYSIVGAAGYDISPGMVLLPGYLEKIDDYSLIYHSSRCSRAWEMINGIWPTPREVTEVDGFTDWETVVGTGPWIPTSHDPAVLVTFERNPDYWQYDPVHPENQLPYADELHLVVIDDQTAFYSALQTGQLDVGTVPWDKITFFRENYPQMEESLATITSSGIMHLRNDIAPFDDIRVRHAAMLAIDQWAIYYDRYQGEFAEFFTWPQLPWNDVVYQPFDTIPEDIQELFDYNPERARELLAEAGYPDGFETNMVVFEASAEGRELSQIFQSYLSDVGIDVTLQQVDYNTGVSYLWGKSYETMILSVWGNDRPSDALAWCEDGADNSPYNFSAIEDEIATQVYMEIGCMADDDEYYARLKEDDIRRLRDMHHLLFPSAIPATYWWPWFKNYHGEQDLGSPDETSANELPKYYWIDQDLKDDMGY